MPKGLLTVCLRFCKLEQNRKNTKLKMQNLEPLGARTLSLAGDRTSAASSTLDSKLYRSDFVSVFPSFHSNDFYSFIGRKTWNFMTLIRH